MSADELFAIGEQAFTRASTQLRNLQQPVRSRGKLRVGHLPVWWKRSELRGRPDLLRDILRGYRHRSGQLRLLRQQLRGRCALHERLVRLQHGLRQLRWKLEQRVRIGCEQRSGESRRPARISHFPAPASAIPISTTATPTGAMAARPIFSRTRCIAADAGPLAARTPIAPPALALATLDTTIATRIGPMGAK